LATLSSQSAAVRPERLRAPEAATRWRRAAADGLGTAFLLAVVVGSGIMGERLSGGNEALALLINSLATGAGLLALILGFSPLSGAHLNPVVTLSEAWRGSFPWRDAPAYVGFQIFGALCGVMVAHLMFGQPVLTLSHRPRAGLPQMLAEFVATFGLVLVIRGSSRLGVLAVAVAVGAFIASAYWFTSSTSFANPAVTIARAFTNSFTGIRPIDVPGFLVAQVLGGVAAAWVLPRLADEQGS
jgi:glycerol uptake facilitator-like aquaporin